MSVSDEKLAKINQVDNYMKCLYNGVKKCGIMKKVEIKIYGGYIRYKYGDDESLSDVDVYIMGNHSQNSFLWMLKSVVEELKSYSEVKEVKTTLITPFVRSFYGTVKLKIEDINGEYLEMDMSATLNNVRGTGFNTICDYTVNNLYMDYSVENGESVYGELKLRQECNYSIDEVLYHLKEKKLVGILDKNAWMAYVERDAEYYADAFGCQCEYDIIEIKNWHTEKLMLRKDKMLERGYVEEVGNAL